MNAPSTNSPSTNAPRTDVRQYSGRLVLALASMVITFFALTQAGPVLGKETWSHSYYGGIEVKHAAAKRAAESGQRRIVFSGGSSVAMGVKSRLIGERLGFAPVNLGLSAAFGSRFIVNELDDVVGCGDVVVFTLEYDVGVNPSLSAMGPLLLQSPYAKRYAHLSLADQIRVRAIYFRETLDARLSGVHRSSTYDRSVFDDAGDFARELPPINRTFTKADLSGGKPVAIKTFAHLKRVFERAEDRGATVFLTSPPYPETGYALRKADLDAYWKLAGDTFGADHLLLAPSETTFPENQFNDTVYHLIATGRTAFSNRIADRLASLSSRLQPTKACTSS